MTSLSFDAEIFGAIIRDVFDYLPDKGFQFSAVSLKHTDAIGDYAEMLVSQQHIGRSILFMYIPPIIHPEGISVFLQNDSGDTFSIDDFLAYKKINYQLDSSLRLTSYTGSTEDKFKGLLSASSQIILQYLDGYLFGKQWEPIPIQWGDLK
ncbi:MAG TPA: hypothetical protein VFG03_06460 [Telluria sp.]|nr:hypothetical protein [Telluria sp.]